jgi:hypothetical protein
MRRLCCFVLLLATTAAAVASSAGAEAPLREPANNEPLVVPAGIWCSFAVRLEAVEDHQTVTVFAPDRNGDTRVLITGHLVVRLSNADVASGKSIVLNSSGPAVIVIHPDGSQTDTTLGPATIGFHPGDEPGGPRILYLTGRATFDITSENVLIDFAATGKIRSNDLCASLAA